jgi:predicted dehydrogenase
VTPLRIAVIGAGHLGRIHAKLFAQVDDAELVAIVDPVESARQLAQSTFGVPTFASQHEVLDRIDAAVIASPSDLHAAAATDLLTAGKHVFVEKPITVCPADADRLVQLAQARRRTLQVGHVERFNPAWTAAAEVTAQAKYIEAVRASRFPGRCLDVGVVMDLMIHDIDLVLSLSSGPLREVRASGLALVSDHEDIAEARLEFECGLVANLKASRVSPTPARQMKTFGPGGFAEIDFGSLSLNTIRPDAAILDRSFDLATVTSAPLKFADQLFADYLTPVTIQVEPRNAILDELHDFVISIRSQSEPTVSGWAGARAVTVAGLILDQIAMRRWTGSTAPEEIGSHAIPLEGIEAASRRLQRQRRSA